MKIANKTKEIIHTQYQWAALGYVVSEGCPGEEMWINGMLENTAVYFRKDEVEKNARKANAYIGRLAKDRANEERKRLLRRDAERKASQVKYVCVIALDATHKILSSGASWKVWLGEMGESDYKKDTVVQKFLYLPKSVAAIEFDKGRSKATVTVPKWLFEEKSGWLPSLSSRRRIGSDIVPSQIE